MPFYNFVFFFLSLLLFLPCNAFLGSNDRDALRSDLCRLVRHCIDDQREYSDVQSQTSINTECQNTQVEIETLETTTQTSAGPQTVAETQTASATSKESDTQTTILSQVTNGTQTKVLHQSETETQTKTPGQNQSSTQTSAVNDNPEISTQTKTSQLNDGITQTKVSQLNDNITQTKTSELNDGITQTKVSVLNDGETQTKTSLLNDGGTQTSQANSQADDAPVKIILEKPTDESIKHFDDVDNDVCCKYLASDDVCGCGGDVSGGDGDSKVDDNECSFSCSSECSSCSCLDPSTNLESQFSQNPTDVPPDVQLGGDESQPVCLECEACAEQPETADEKDDTEPTLIEVTAVATVADNATVAVEIVPEVPKEPVKVEPVVAVKPSRRSDSKSRKSHHDKGSAAASAPAVQFEITPKGVRVISEKESFL